MTTPLLGRPEAAMLLAVEQANGGELSGLEQVLVAFEFLFERRMRPEAYAESCALLCEAELVEYRDDSLGLTPAGRKLLRRTGVPGNPERPHKVAEQLALLEALDLAVPGSVAAPPLAAFEAASATLSSDGEAGEEPVLGSELAPPPLGNLSPYGWMDRPPPPSARSHLFHRHEPLPDVPLVRPHEAAEEEGPEAGG